MLPLDRLRSSAAAGLSMGMLVKHSMKHACQATVVTSSLAVMVQVPLVAVPT